MTQTEHPRLLFSPGEEVRGVDSKPVTDKGMVGAIFFGSKPSSTARLSVVYILLEWEISLHRHSLHYCKRLILHFSTSDTLLLSTMTVAVGDGTQHRHNGVGKWDWTTGQSQALPCRQWRAEKRCTRWSSAYDAVSIDSQNLMGRREKDGETRTLRMIVVLLSHTREKKRPKTKRGETGVGAIIEGTASTSKGQSRNTFDSVSHPPLSHLDRPPPDASCPASP